MNLRTTKTTTGTVKVFDDHLKVYNGQSELVVAVEMNKGTAHQLIHELNDWLRYPE